MSISHGFAAPARSFPPAGPASTLREIWQYRELLRMLTVRALKVKYKRSTLGFIWTLLNPLLTVGVLVTVFSYFVKLDVPEYWAFLVSGYFVWNFIQMALTAGTRVMAEHAALAKSIRVPGQIFVLSSVAARFLEFMIELGLVLIALLLVHHGGVPIGFAALPALILIQFVLVTGLVLPIATLAVFYDDVQHILPVLLMVLFYVSPVFYPAELVPQHLRELYLLNPIADLLGAFQLVLYHGQLPDAGTILSLGALSLVTLGVGYAVFERYCRVFVEIL